MAVLKLTLDIIKRFENFRGLCFETYLDSKVNVERGLFKKKFGKP